jgi:hypothetical protein
MLRLSLLLGMLMWIGCDDNLRAAEDAAAPDDADKPSDGDAEPSEPDAGDRDADLGDASAEAGICTRCGACEKNIRVSSAIHRSDPIDYTDPPPVGGDHNPCWTTFGLHANEVADERWVHNLEHGAVMFLYNCPEGCDAERDQLKQLLAGRKFGLVMPYAALPTRFGMVAWENRLLSDCFDESAFTAFYDAHVNRAPESSTSGPPSGCP